MKYEEFKKLENKREWMEERLETEDGKLEINRLVHKIVNNCDHDGDFILTTHAWAPGHTFPGKTCAKCKASLVYFPDYFTWEHAGPLLTALIDNGFVFSKSRGYKSKGIPPKYSIAKWGIDCYPEDEVEHEHDTTAIVTAFLLGG
jgi:hypothetical protein